MEVKIKGIYKHFKGGLYFVEDIAIHTETDEKLVIYRHCSDDVKTLFARPIEMFTSKVDKKTYPNASQKYRFELYDTHCKQTK